MKSNYVDIKRNSGSQSEVPILTVNPDTIKVEGYNQFSIDRKSKNIHIHNRKIKFEIIKRCLNLYANIKGCSNFIDIGCSSGLSSHIALSEGFKFVHCLDHDNEYLEMAELIFLLTGKSNMLKIYKYSFGDDFSSVNFIDSCDFVFCGALIHWIFNLTAEFRDFGKIFDYLLSIDFKYLMIEWINEHDSCILKFDHIGRNRSDIDEVYNTANFEKALFSRARLVEKINTDIETRIFYIVEKF